MAITTRRPFAAFVLALLALSAVAEAGGPLLLVGPGQPFRWINGGVAIPFNPDLGGLGPLTNAQAVAQTAAAFGAWAAIPSARATHSNQGPLPVDVDETNFLPYFLPTAPDGVSAIVFDEDGAIFELLFGPDSGVLGFASPEWLDDATGEIIEGVAFMNGGALLGEDAFPAAEFLSVQVHEFGHYQNLAHTVVNGQIAGFRDSRGPTPFNTFPPPPTFAGRIETMYPFMFEGGGQATPHADDVAIFSELYPEPGFAASTGAIRGRIIAPNDRTRLTGVNVIARNVANPYDDAVSAISSDFATDYASNAPLAGTYTLRGLTPGASYAVYVDQILAGGFSTPPRVLPGPEEFFNGVNESSDGATDAPGEFAAIPVAAGGTVSNVDIIFNARTPGPLTLGDDSSAEIFTEFPLRFCGQTYDSVWINANGNLTFGAPSSAYSESPGALLAGVPRIAALWDDLNPAAGGTVSFSSTRAAFSVTFDGVPEYMATTGNSFSVTLRNSPLGHLLSGVQGGMFSLDYGTIAAAGGLAGYSCGGRVTSGFELERDLSAMRLPIVLGLREPAVFEHFTTDNDLDDARFVVVTPRPFRDVFEPNDTLAPAVTAAALGGGHDAPDLVRLPFSTVDRYSAIEPLGGDVDYFRFRARAGDILAIETVPGNQVDTLIGLFDGAGNLLLTDDDGGVGVLSRLLVQIPADGVYAVGVTTYPDVEFTGAGGDYGRYVLNISAYRGTVLPVSDDGAVEVPFPSFQFPFQGTMWSSVFVNGNGNLTFGVADPDFSETVAELLSGPPRIAPMWDDLSVTDPITGSRYGLVIAEERPGKLLIHYVSVPEFMPIGTNYFTVELDRGGGIAIRYGATNRADALVGVSPGLGAVDPGATDLSEARVLRATGTTYESFAGAFGPFGGVDLSFTELRFRRP
jgi:hypothetical protein